MKAMACFSVDDLRLATGIGENTAKTYVRRLERAGYLAVVDPGRWRLLPSRNTGPRAPGIRHHRKLPQGADQAQRVFDFNAPALAAASPAPSRPLRPVAGVAPVRPAGRARPETRKPAQRPAVDNQAVAAAEPTNVVRLDAYRKDIAAQAAQVLAAPEGDREERARAYKRKWTGRALRIVDIAQASDRPVTWRRAARLIDHIYHRHMPTETLSNLAADCALLSISDEAG